MVRSWLCCWWLSEVEDGRTGAQRGKGRRPIHATVRSGWRGKTHSVASEDSPGISTPPDVCSHIVKGLSHPWFNVG